MKLTSNKVLVSLLYLISISGFITAQESTVEEYGYVYVINLSSYHARVFVDGHEKGTALADGTFTTTLQGD